MSAYAKPRLTRLVVGVDWAAAEADLTALVALRDGLLAEAPPPPAEPDNPRAFIGRRVRVPGARSLGLGRVTGLRMKLSGIFGAVERTQVYVLLDGLTARSDELLLGLAEVEFVPDDYAEASDAEQEQGRQIKPAGAA